MENLNDEKIRRIENLKKVQDITRPLAIYQPDAKGNYDTSFWTKEDKSTEPTWCNQSCYDIMEATGVHMEAFYGKKGTRRTGYDVTANQACQNVEKYRKNFVTDYASKAILKETQSIVEFNPKKYEELHKKGSEAGRKECPIQEISAEEADKLASQGYTVVAMWENPKKKQSGHMATLLPDDHKDYNPKVGPDVSNVGAENGIKTVNEAFDGSKKVKYYYDKNQTFKPNAGFDKYGIGYDNRTQKQSITIYDPRYNEYDYKHHDLRKQEEEKLINTLPDFNKQEKEAIISKLRELCGRHNITLAGEIAKHRNDLKKIFTGEITLDYYVTKRSQALEQARKKAAALEKARKEAEAAAAEKARKEAEAAAAEKARKEAEAAAAEKARKEAEAAAAEKARKEAAAATTNNSNNDSSSDSNSDSSKSSESNKPSSGTGGSSKPPKQNKPSTGTGGSSKPSKPNKPSAGSGSSPKPPKQNKPSTGGSGSSKPSKPNKPSSGSGGGTSGGSGGGQRTSYSTCSIGGGKNTQYPLLGDYYIEYIKSKPVSSSTLPPAYYSEPKDTPPQLQGTINIGLSGTPSSDIVIEDMSKLKGNEWA